MKITTITAPPVPKFRPVTVTITLESFEELRSLTARTDISPQVLTNRGGFDRIYGREEFEYVTDLWRELTAIYKPLAEKRGGNS